VGNRAGDGSRELVVLCQKFPQMEDLIEHVRYGAFKFVFVNMNGLDILEVSKRRNVTTKFVPAEP
jgi:hypothetical protein